MLGARGARPGLGPSAAASSASVGPSTPAVHELSRGAASGDVGHGDALLMAAAPARMEDAGPARPRALVPGAVVAGRYRIEKPLGVGGMGAVFEATHLAMQRPVALKVLRSEYSDDPAMAARFEREARAASAVRHAGVVVVHDFGQDLDGTLFLVMELLRGETLLERLRRDRALSPREAVGIACAMLSALEAAHTAGVVHRDLKPDNVMLLSPFSGEERGALKVLDFGIARIVDRGRASSVRPAADLTDVGQTLGTPRYISPEAVARLPVGPSADLYALGAILFEMIAGRAVFEDGEPIILMGQHLRDVPPRLTRVVPPSVTVPAALDVLVAELLAKLPSDRPGGAAEVRARLEALDWTVSASPAWSGAFTPPPSLPDVRYARNKGSLRGALRFSPLVLLVAGVAGSLYLQRARLEERRARAEAEASDAPVAAAAPPVSSGPRVPVVRMTVQGAPRDATFWWDGVRQPGNPFDVTQDGLSHRLEIRGRRTRVVEVVADGPHDLNIRMERPQTR